MIDPMSVEDLTASQLSDLCDELRDEWEASTELSVRGQHLDKLAPVYGLAAHCYYLGTEVAQLLRREEPLKAAPLLRVMLESSVQAQWLVRIPGATNSLLNEAARQQRFLAKSVRLAQFSFSEEIAAQLDDAWPEMHRAELSPKFEAVCRDLSPAGQGLYAQYRLLSALIHPGPTVAGRYIRFTADERIEMLAIAPLPDQADMRGWWWLTAVSLIWAATAVDWVDKSKSMRKVTARIAEMIEAPPTLRQSDQAWVRSNKPKAGVDKRKQRNK